MKYLIFRLTEKEGDEFRVECDNLDREDATGKEKAIAELIEASITNLLEYMNSEDIIKTLYTKEIK
jgi:hypothetical protein